MKYKYWLSNIPGIAGSKIQILLEQFSGAQEIYEADVSSLSKVFKLSKNDQKQIEESKRTWNLEEEWNRFQESGAGFVSLEDAGYPSRLRNILNPPYSLYYVGSLPVENFPSIGIVGARGRSSYGSQIAQKLGEMLGQNQVNVISGMARGIDGDAHIGTLRVEGKTYAVLGCGVDVIYPKENRFIYEQILESGGGIISEFPLRTQPRKELFPSRNRIIAGMSDKICVIEARKKSGSLITADFAMEQGKDVYALPGRITDELSEGCNLLIQQGASPIVSLSDFMSEVLQMEKCGAVQLDFHKNLLEKDETLVYIELDFQPVSIAKLLHQTELELGELLEILERLEHKGFVKEIVTNYFVKTI